MRDPNNIDLQSVDPDLSQDDQNPSRGFGVDDLQDYADSVTAWGSDVIDTMTGEGEPGPGIARRPARSIPSGGYFHPRHKITTPFAIAALAVMLILVIVFFPKTGG